MDLYEKNDTSGKMVTWGEELLKFSTNVAQHWMLLLDIPDFIFFSMCWILKFYCEWWSNENLKAYILVNIYFWPLFSFWIPILHFKLFTEMLWLFMNVCQYLCLYEMCTYFLWRLAEDTRSSWTWKVGGCELTWESWEWNPDPLWIKERKKRKEDLATYISMWENLKDRCVEESGMIMARLSQTMWGERGGGVRYESSTKIGNLVQWEYVRNIGS